MPYVVASFQRGSIMVSISPQVSTINSCASLRKKTLMACRLQGWRRVRWCTVKLVGINTCIKKWLLSHVLQFFIWISTSSICCSHIWVGICSSPSFDVSSLALQKKFWHKRGGHVDFDIAQAWRKEPCFLSAVIPAEIFFWLHWPVPLPQDGACEVANSDQCNL